MSDLGLIGRAAESVGTTEPALKLIFTVLLGYPIAYIHRLYFYGQPPALQHVFLLSTGFILGYFNFGIEILHTTATILVVYLILKTIGGTLHSVIITLIFTMVYLIVGYAKTMTDSYDIVWTLPHCILVLRLTGVAFDIYDGSFPEESQSKDSKKNGLREVPSLLELAAFSYCPTSTFVGPQYPMRRYQDFIAGRLKPNLDQHLPDCVKPALKRGALGVFYLLMHTVGTSIYSDDYVLGEEFSNASFIRRCVDLGIWGHFVLQKYVAIWLLTEGSCILLGLTYNGRDANGNPKWDGCANVNVWLFECAQNFAHDYIDCFNINTNLWVLQYIYKRLRFLGNKYYSQIGVLSFLSVWHGLHSGYYMTFVMEFFAVIMEKDFEVVLNRNKVFLEFLARPGIREVKWVLLKIYTIVFMGPCIAPLAVLSFRRWWKLYRETYCFALVFWASWFVWKPLALALLPPQRERKD